MFVFLKLIQPFFLPPTLFFLFLVVSLFLLIRKHYRWAKIFLCITLVGYYLFSIEPVSHFLTVSLERMIPVASIEEAKNAEAIVVLAGGADEQDEDHPVAELGGVSWRRLWHGIELYRALDGRIPLLYSGGSGDPFRPISTEAALAKRYALSFGILSENFLVDAESRTTYESGGAVKKILDVRFPNRERHTILLVTSARHMPRAFAVMQKLGFHVLSAPADFSGGTFALTPLSFFPTAFSTTAASMHEWVGLAGYWLLGRI